MTSFRTIRRVPFEPRQLFDLIADVEQYPKFMPMCERLVVRKREQQGADEVLIADMTVGYKAIHETFTSRVVLSPDQFRVVARVMPELGSGPFRQLENRWQFRAAPGGCDVEFFITYDFKSLMLQMLVGGLFERVFRRYSDAFEARAHAVYGGVAQASPQGS